MDVAAAACFREEMQTFFRANKVQDIVLSGGYVVFLSVALRIKNTRRVSDGLFVQNHRINCEQNIVFFANRTLCRCKTERCVVAKQNIVSFRNRTSCLRYPPHPTPSPTSYTIPLRKKSTRGKGGRPLNSRSGLYVKLFT